MLRAVTEHFKPVVSPIAYTGVVLTDEHVDQIIHAEALAGAGNAGHGLPRGLGAVPGLRRVQAIVAIPAVRPRLFPKVGANGPATARGEFAQADHGFQLLVLHPLVRLVGFGPGQPLAENNNFLQTVIHPRAGRQAVSARTTRFLVIRLNALREAQVGDKAHVGFVDAHAERDRGHDHHALLAQEPFLVPAARVIRQARVVRQRVTPAGAQPLGGLLHPFARQAIHDTRVRGVFALQKAPQALAPVLVVGDGVPDVGAVTTVDVEVGFFQLQLGDDFTTGGVVRSGRQGDARDRGIPLVQHRQLQILLTEVVPPARHAMRFVDREQGDGLRVQPFQGPFLQQALRRHVEQIQPPAVHRGLHRPDLLEVEGGVQAGRPYPALAKRVHLVLHQRDQGRHHDPHPGAHHGRDLVTQRLAPARRHQDHGVPAGQQIINHFLLAQAKRSVSEDGPEKTKRVIGGEKRFHSFFTPSSAVRRWRH